MLTSTVGSLFVNLTFAVCLLSVVVLILTSAKPARYSRRGFAAVLLTTMFATLCCLVLLLAFAFRNNSILYVAEYSMHGNSGLRWLYVISGLWAGRSGSLLFWAWLLSMFNASVALRSLRKSNIIESPTTPRHLASLASSAAPRQPQPRGTRLDSLACAVGQSVLLAFLAVLVFSPTNQPFAATPSIYLSSSGELIGAAVRWGLNPLLQHWAMVLHPPTLFAGYAGLTIPFSYALAAVIAGDDSHRWVDACRRYVLVSWLLLTLGIGLGSVWAYVVLGWGGYWGWDPVENASLLSWLMTVALTHSLTVYRTHHAFRRFSVMLASLAFAFVIVGTFITRSGIVASVHAFDSDPVSLVLFAGLIIVSLLVTALGLLIRRNAFQTKGDESEDLLTRDTAYYFNNVIMLIVVLLITYLTLASALPTPLPLAGQAVAASFYGTLARPMGILYCLVLAICPLLSWGRADLQALLQRARVPMIVAGVLFAVCMVYFALRLVPAYDSTIANGGSNANLLRDAGPRWSYLAVTIIGFLAACLLFGSSLVSLIRHHRRAAQVGGSLSHLGLAVILAGLIGSSMYVTDNATYVIYDADTDTATNTAQVGDYSLAYNSLNIVTSDDGKSINYSLTFDVYRNEKPIGQVSPSIDINQLTGQFKYNAAVINGFSEDLFVVFSNVTNQGWFSLDLKVNPLISLVWLGLAILASGTAIAAFAPQRFGASKGFEPDLALPPDQLESTDQPTAEHLDKPDA